MGLEKPGFACLPLGYLRDLISLICSLVCAMGLLPSCHLFLSIKWGSVYAGGFGCGKSSLNKSYLQSSELCFLRGEGEGGQVGTHFRDCLPLGNCLPLGRGSLGKTVPVGEDSPGMGLTGRHLGSAWTGGTFTDAAVGGERLVVDWGTQFQPVRAPQL